MQKYPVLRIEQAITSPFRYKSDRRERDIDRTNTAMADLVQFRIRNTNKVNTMHIYLRIFIYTPYSTNSMYSICASHSQTRVILIIWFDMVNILIFRLYNNLSIWRWNRKNWQNIMRARVRKIRTNFALLRLEFQYFWVLLFFNTFDTQKMQKTYNNISLLKKKMLERTRCFPVMF